MLVQVAQCNIQIKKFKIEKVLSAYSGKEGERKKANCCIGKKSSLHIASSPGEQRKIPGQ